MVVALPRQPNSLVSIWFLVSSLVVCWDMGYIAFRPRSMPGGDLHWLWSPYALYGTIDYIYGAVSWNAKDGFPAAQTTMNLFETAFNFLYLYMAHVSGSATQEALAPLVGFTSVIMTVSKTLLYMFNDYFCGWCKTGHNDLYNLIVLFAIPNGAWIVVPSIIAVILGRGIVRDLLLANGVINEAGTKISDSPAKSTRSSTRKLKSK